MMILQLINGYDLPGDSKVLLFDQAQNAQQKRNSKIKIYFNYQ